MRIMHVPVQPPLVEGGLGLPALVRLRDDIAKAAGDEEAMLSLLGSITRFEYEDSPDLYDWIPALDAMDAQLERCLQRQPALLLFRDVEPPKDHVRGPNSPDVPPAGLLPSPPPAELQQQQRRELPLLLAVLNFTSLLLRHSLNKHVYNSSDHLLAMLAARDDALAAKALECVTMLALPPMLHRQQQPDLHGQTYAIHDDKTASAKLMELAHGWGGRGQGLGLLACLTADESTLPQHAGDLYFELSHESEGGVSGSGGGGGSYGGAGAPPGQMNRAPSPGVVVIHFPEVHKQKGTAAALFERVVAQYDVPRPRWMALLARVRLAKSFATRESRGDAVVRRLLALVALVHCQSSPEALLSYFHVQPELTQELVDLVRAHTDARLRHLVPLPARLLSVHTLTAMVAARNGGGANGALSNIARHTNVFQELGVGRGQYTGLLPSLLRYAVAAMTGGFAAAGGGSSGGASGASASSASQQPSFMRAGASSLALLDLSLGLAFVEAAAGSSGGGGAGRLGPLAAESSPVEVERDQLSWIEGVFTLIHAVVGVQTGAAAMTDCGLVSALLGVVQLHVDSLALGPIEPFERRYIICQAIQILETAIVNHSGAHTMFRDLGATELLCGAFREEVAKLRADYLADGSAAAEADAEMAVDEEPAAAAAAAAAGGGPKDKAGDMPAPASLAAAAPEAAVSGAAMDVAPATEEGAEGGVAAAAAAGADPAQFRTPRRVNPPSHSQKTLLYTLLNCLGVGFHSQGATHTAGSAQLRNPELTTALIDVFDNVPAFGPQLVALAATLVSDVINNDPAVVTYVHGSGLAAAMLRVLKDPKMPASGELLMAIPTMLSALSLTNAGADAVQAADIFPSVFGLLQSDAHTMPSSRCFLGDIASILGQGMDELMRHVPRLKPDCMTALVAAVKKLVATGEALNAKEISGDESANASELAAQRARLFQHITHAAQVLEPILSKAEHIAPFCEKGGLGALLALYPLALLGPRAFLLNAAAAAAPLSPAVGSAAAAGTMTASALAQSATSRNFVHAPAASALSSALSSFCTVDPLRLLTSACAELTSWFKRLELKMGCLRSASEADAPNQREAMNAAATASAAAAAGAAAAAASSAHQGKGKGRAATQGASDDSSSMDIDMELPPRLTPSVLSDVPAEPLHVAFPAAACGKAKLPYVTLLHAEMLQGVMTLDWLSWLFTSAIRGGHALQGERGGRFATEMSRPATKESIQRLLAIHRELYQDACVAVAGAERPAWQNPDVFHLRVICSSGSVVREGVEIELSPTLLTLELGTLVNAYERVANAGGVIRYRTDYGWISEQMRGGGRQPLVEIYGVSVDHELAQQHAAGASGLPAALVASLRGTGAAVLARLQGGAKSLMGALGKVVMISSRHQPDSVHGHLTPYAPLVGDAVVDGIGGMLTFGTSGLLSQGKVAAGSLYLVAALELARAVLLDERRHAINCYILMQMEKKGVLAPLIQACGTVVTAALQENTSSKAAAAAASSASDSGYAEHKASELESPGLLERAPPGGRTGAAAVSLEAAMAALSLLKRLANHEAIMCSPSTLMLVTSLRRDSSRDATSNTSSSASSSASGAGGANKKDQFDPDRLVRTLHARYMVPVVLKLWQDRSLYALPASHVAWVLQVGLDLMESLEFQGDFASSMALKERVAGGGREGAGGRSGGGGGRRSPWGWWSGRGMGGGGGGGAGPMAVLQRMEPAPPFVPSPEVAAQLEEMGFSHDHVMAALRATTSNRVEVAMEYLLTHPPPPPSAAPAPAAASAPAAPAEEAETPDESGPATVADVAAVAAAVADNVAATSELAAATSELAAAIAGTIQAAVSRATATAPDAPPAAEAAQAAVPGAAEAGAPSANPTAANRSAERALEGLRTAIRGLSGHLPPAAGASASPPAAAATAAAAAAGGAGAAAAGASTTTGSAQPKTRKPSPAEVERERAEAAAELRGECLVAQADLNQLEDVGARACVDLIVDAARSDEGGAAGAGGAGSASADPRNALNVVAAQFLAGVARQRQHRQAKSAARFPAPKPAAASAPSGRAAEGSESSAAATAASSDGAEEAKEAPHGAGGDAAAAAAAEAGATSTDLAAAKADAEEDANAYDTLIRVIQSLFLELLTSPQEPNSSAEAGRSRALFSLCHVLVLMVAIAPDTRPLLSENGFPSCVVDALEEGVSAVEEAAAGTAPAEWPPQLTAYVLLLDLLAQPRVEDSGAAAAASAAQPLPPAEGKNDAGSDPMATGEDDVKVDEFGNAAGVDQPAEAVAPAPAKKESVAGDAAAGEKAEEGDGAAAAPSTPQKQQALPDVSPLLTAAESQRVLDVLVRLLKGAAATSAAPAAAAAAAPAEERAVAPLAAPSPSLAHAVLQLVARLVRSFELAARFVDAGGATALVRLPASSSFDSRVALVTVIMRHLLEEPAVLQAAMESEIRATFSRMTQRASRTTGQPPGEVALPLQQFIGALSPLLVRDRDVFLRAMENTLQTVPPSAPAASPSTAQATQPAQVVLRPLAPAVAASGAAGAVAAAAAAAGGERSAAAKPAGSGRAGGNASTPGSRGKARDRKTPGGGNGDVVTGAAAAAAATPEKARNAAAAAGQGRSAVMSMLLSELLARDPEAEVAAAIAAATRTTSSSTTVAAPAAAGSTTATAPAASNAEGSVGSGSAAMDVDGDATARSNGAAASAAPTPQSAHFLGVVDLLEVLSELVLAFPASAAAVHRFGHRNVPLNAPTTLAAMNQLRGLRHAIAGCEAPPPTVVGVLLHRILPSPRQAPSSLEASAGGSEDKRKRKTASAVAARPAQAAARLLVALCARGGEGRRRVLAELTEALSCRGTLYSSAARGSAVASIGPPRRGQLAPAPPMTLREMWALQTWGEMVMGLAAPRATQSQSSSTSDAAMGMLWDVVRVMDALGMVQALTRALCQLDLSHSRATLAASALVRPLEALSRPSVVDFLKKARAKDEDKARAAGEDGGGGGGGPPGGGGGGGPSGGGGGPSGGGGRGGRSGRSAGAVAAADDMLSGSGGEGGSSAPAEAARAHGERRSRGRRRETAATARHWHDEGAAAPTPETGARHQQSTSQRRRQASGRAAGTTAAAAGAAAAASGANGEAAAAPAAAATPVQAITPVGVRTELSFTDDEGFDTEQQERAGQMDVPLLPTGTGTGSNLAVAAVAVLEAVAAAGGNPPGMLPLYHTDEDHVEEAAQAHLMDVGLPHASFGSSAVESEGDDVEEHLHYHHHHHHHRRHRHHADEDMSDGSSPSGSSDDDDDDNSDEDTEDQEGGVEMEGGESEENRSVGEEEESGGEEEDDEDGEDGEGEDEDDQEGEDENGEERDEEEESQDEDMEEEMLRIDTEGGFGLMGDDGEGGGPDDDDQDGGDGAGEDMGTLVRPAMMPMSAVMGDAGPLMGDLDADDGMMGAGAGQGSGSVGSNGDSPDGGGDAAGLGWHPADAGLPPWLGDPGAGVFRVPHGAEYIRVVGPGAPGGPNRLVSLVDYFRSAGGGRGGGAAAAAVGLPQGATLAFRGPPPGAVPATGGGPPHGAPSLIQIVRNASTGEGGARAAGGAGGAAAGGQAASSGTSRLFPTAPSGAQRPQVPPAPHPLLAGVPAAAAAAQGAGVARRPGRRVFSSGDGTVYSATRNVMEYEHAILEAIEGSLGMLTGRGGGTASANATIDANGHITISSYVPNYPYGPPGAGPGGSGGGAGSGGGGAVTNETRWTDDGQPFTAAGSNLAPLISGAERLLAGSLRAASPWPQQPQPQQQEAGGDASVGGSADAAASAGNDNADDSAMVEDTAGESRAASAGTEAANASESAQSAADSSRAHDHVEPTANRASEEFWTAVAEWNPSAAETGEQAPPGAPSTPSAAPSASGATQSRGAAAAAAAAPAAATAAPETPRAPQRLPPADSPMDYASSGSEGDAVAALTSSLSISPRRERGAPSGAAAAADAEAFVPEVASALRAMAGLPPDGPAAEAGASGAGADSEPAPMAVDGEEEAPGAGSSGAAQASQAAAQGAAEVPAAAAAPSAMEEEPAAAAAAEAAARETETAPDEVAAAAAAAAEGEAGGGGGDSSGGLRCPPGIDPEVFAALPPEMQEECIREAGGSDGADEDTLASEAIEAGMDREALMALPPDLRAEVLADARQRRRRAAAAAAAEAPADPANARDMDNASFVASLTPDLRAEVLMTADDALLASLPPNLVAEAMLLRERGPHRFGAAGGASAGGGGGGAAAAGAAAAGGGMAEADGAAGGGAMRLSRMPTNVELGGPGFVVHRAPGSSARFTRMDALTRRVVQVARGSGLSAQQQQQLDASSREAMIRVESDAIQSAAIAAAIDRPAMATAVRLLHLLHPVRPHRLLQRLLLNLSLVHPRLRRSIVYALVSLAAADRGRLRRAVALLPAAAAAPASGARSNHNSRLPLGLLPGATGEAGGTSSSPAPVSRAASGRRPRGKGKGRGQRALRVAAGGAGGGGGGGDSDESDSEPEQQPGGGAGAGGGGGGPSGGGGSSGVPRGDDGDDEASGSGYGGPAGASSGGAASVPEGPDTDSFPPAGLIGSAGLPSGYAVPAAVGGATVHPVVARRTMELLSYLAKVCARIRHDILVAPADGPLPEMMPAAAAGAGRAGAAASASLSAAAEAKTSRNKGKGRARSGGRAAAAAAAAGTPAVAASGSADSMNVDNEEGAAAAAAAAGAAGGNASPVLLESIVGLLDSPVYTLSTNNLDQLLQLLEVVVAPLAQLRPPGSAGAARPAAAAARPAAAAAEAKAESSDPGVEETKGEGAAGAAAAAGCAGAAAAAADPNAGADPNADRMQVEIEPSAGDAEGAPAEGREAGSRPPGAGASEAKQQASEERFAWVDIPRPVLSAGRLHLLCSALRLETCSEAAFQRASNVLANLSRVPENRAMVLGELVSVAKMLGACSVADLDALMGTLRDALSQMDVEQAAAAAGESAGGPGGAAAAASKGKAPARPADAAAAAAIASRKVKAAIPASAVTLISSSSELKLLRVLQTLRALSSSREELGALLARLELAALWDLLSDCLQVVSALEGVPEDEEQQQQQADEPNNNGAAPAGASGGARSGAAARAGSRAPSTAGSGSEAVGGGGGGGGGGAAGEGAGAGTHGQNSAMAGLLARFLPVIEAFFVVNTRDPTGSSDAQEPTAAATDSSVSNSGTAADTPVTGDEDAKEDGSAAAAAGTEAAAAAAGAAMDAESADRVLAWQRLLEQLPGARFRRNVPVNMRPFVESEAMAAPLSASARRLRDFVARHRVLLNALLNQNQALMDKSLSAMVQNPNCRQYLDFNNKRSYFRSQLKKMRQSSLRRSLRIAVPRDKVFEYSFYSLGPRTAEEMRGRLHIKFQGEEGIDAGGLTREWYSILAKEIFNANYALFKSAADGATFQPNPLSGVNPDHLAYFKFVGRIVGKAIADGQLLDAHFTRSFYKHILGVPVTYHDMEAIDPEYYKNLLQILEVPLEVLGLELSFSGDFNDWGRVETVDLKPNGRNILVTSANKLEYVQLVTQHRMTESIRKQIEAFLEGFHELVPPELVSIFTPKELELLISGMPDIDLDDLQANTEYSHYKNSDPQIQWFWNVLRSFTREEKALFLQFVTGTSKVPLEGFAHLQGMRGIQRFNIHKAYGSPDLLPSAHTCFNQLDLPEYPNEEKTRERLLLALREGSEGFGFG